MAKIACIGHTTIDIIFLVSQGHLQTLDASSQELCVPFPSKMTIDQRFISLGGNAPNVGAGLIKTGHQVELISRVGQDELGEIILAKLREWGFSLTYTSIEGDTDSSVILSYEGDRTILAYHSPFTYGFPKSLQGVDWVYLSSLGFADFIPLHHDLLDWLKQNNKVGLVYNPGRPEIEKGFEVVAEILQAAHTILVNKQEAEKILGHSPSDQSDVSVIKGLLEDFIRRGIQKIVITNGRDGAYFSNAIDSCYHIEALPDPPMDATGAGDAFSSGYLTGIAHGREPFEALRLGMAQAASVVNQAGATNGLLTLEELDKKLVEHPRVKARSIA